jgi:hypothetical protein
MPDALDHFFTYNLPIQVTPIGPNGPQVLLYLPRKERLNGWADLADVLPAGVTRAEFFGRAAKIYDNMAALMRHAATEPRAFIYYPNNAPAIVEDETR